MDSSSSRKRKTADGHLETGKKKEKKETLYATCFYNAKTEKMKVVLFKSSQGCIKYTDEAKNDPSHENARPADVEPHDYIIASTKISRLIKYDDEDGLILISELSKSKEKPKLGVISSKITKLSNGFEPALFPCFGFGYAAFEKMKRTIRELCDMEEDKLEKEMKNDRDQVMGMECTMDIINCVAEKPQEIKNSVNITDFIRIESKAIETAVLIMNRVAKSPEDIKNYDSISGLVNSHAMKSCSEAMALGWHGGCCNFIENQGFVTFDWQMIPLKDVKP